MVHEKRLCSSSESTQFTRAGVKVTEQIVKSKGTQTQCNQETLKGKGTLKRGQKQAHISNKIFLSEAGVT